MEEEGRRRNVFGVSRKPSDSFSTMHATVGCDQPVACNMAWWFALMAVAAGTQYKDGLAVFFSIHCSNSDVNTFATPKISFLKLF